MFIFLWISLDGQPPHTPDGTHCLHPLSCSLPQMRAPPTQSPKAQRSHLLAEFWQLLFNVLYVYSLYLLSKFVPNSLLTGLPYSILIPPSHFLHCYKNNFLQRKSHNCGILEFFQWLPHALRVKSKFLSRAV